MVAGLRRWRAQKMHTMRGRDITGWEQFEAASDDGPLHVLMVDTETPVDAMRFTYLEARLESDSGTGIRISWENHEDERFSGPLLEPTGSGPIRLYLRDHPHWQGSLKRLILESGSAFEVRGFRVFGEKDPRPERKLG